MLIVGISGKAGTGKTTMARELLAIFADCRAMAFADALKNEVSRVYNIDRWALDSDKDRLHIDPLLPRSPMTLREILQWHGQARRDEDPGHWVRALERDLMDYATDSLVIIHDVRYPDEAELVMDYRGLLVRLEPYPGCPKAPDHVSESALDGWPAWDLRLRPPYGWLVQAAGQIVAPEIVRRICGGRG
ncbi:MAG: hypothetical protein EOM25_13105 [Deltaproteobacteria bacterium]|nr:hypothetical protein [Deltaproteobacteria bacterium]